MIDKAVLLYHKGGSIAKAVELCFQNQLFDALGQISMYISFDHSLTILADDLPSDTNSALIVKCSDFFMQHKQYNKAINLYIIGGNVPKALELCLQHNVTVTEDMAEKMTPNLKDSPEDPQKLSVLRQIAKVCKRQGSYHLATKKYTQAKDKKKAMKVLLKSGDTEKIIFFASKQFVKYSMLIFFFKMFPKILSCLFWLLIICKV